MKRKPELKEKELNKRLEFERKSSDKLQFDSNKRHGRTSEDFKKKWKENSRKLKTLKPKERR